MRSLISSYLDGGVDGTVGLALLTEGTVGRDPMTALVRDIRSVSSRAASDLTPGSSLDPIQDSLSETALERVIRGTDGKREKARWDQRIMSD